MILIGFLRCVSLVIFLLRLLHAVDYVVIILINLGQSEASIVPVSKYSSLKKIGLFMS